jgi:anaerobic ribonucleoside-triphosphate reductase activating protein
MDTWPSHIHETTVETVLEAADACGGYIDGVTISGGEPFEQPEALRDLLNGLRNTERREIDVLVYSGYGRAELCGHLETMLGLIDVLISGPFDTTAPQTRPLMGSDNQEMHFLTALGRQRFSEFERLRNKADDRLDLMMDDCGSIWMAGIPRKGDLERLRVMLEVEGTIIKTTENSKRQV